MISREINTMKKLFLSKIFLIIFFPLILSGCLESSFKLADESRLPKWFDLSAGKTRGDFYVIMDCYSTFHGSEDVFKLYKKSGFFAEKKITIDATNNSLSVPLKGSKDSYPKYRVITINGITEVIEHRKQEPVFYIVDDPKILDELGVKKLL